jgi:hypothetical protein
VLTTELTEDQARAGALVGALDLEPITYKLMHPHPGETAMTLAEADQVTDAYRGFLKLCLWYPDEVIVPSRTIDEVWHAHILDTAKYAADCDVLFGALAHHFPYFGLRGEQDEASWRAAYDRTRELFQLHFGIALAGERAAAACHVNGASCNANGSICVFDESITCEKTMEATPAAARPRPGRAAAAASGG